jgi:hypothetical protein
MAFNKFIKFYNKFPNIKLYQKYFQIPFGKLKDQFWEITRKFQRSLPKIHASYESRL